MTQVPPSADDSAPATAVPDDGATAVVPDAARTELGELAWSAADPPEAEPVTQPWRAAWSQAGMLLILGLAAAVLVGVLAWMQLSDDQPTGDVAKPSLASTLTLPATPSSTPTSTAAPLQTKDDLFIATIGRNEGREFDRSKALPAAKWVCSQLTDGRTFSSLLQQVKQSQEGKGDRQLSEVQVADFIQQSVHFYCPQLETP